VAGSARRGRAKADRRGPAALRRLCGTAHMLAMALGLAVLAVPGGADDGVLVFAAASLQTALDPVAADYTAETGTAIRVAYASSAALARQIAAGAPADLFVSAHPDWMDWLAARGLIRDETRRDLLGNRLVLVRPAERPGPPGLDLGAGRIAVGLTDAVPAGLYAKAALQSLGLWEVARPRLVETDNVRVALALVARGDVAQGIVYASDAWIEPRVTVVAELPEDSHPPILYPGAVVAGGASGAEAFLDHLSGAEAQARFVASGFRPVERRP